jgi:hypothetical protein
MTTTTAQRKDVHRPSVVRPEEYSFVGIEYMKGDDIGSVQAVLRERTIIEAHMERTGGTYSRHQHSGNCMICGAAAIYTCLFYHQPTNSYVRTGFDCAANLESCDPARFRAVKEGVKSAREAIAGKQKAQAVLKDNGLEEAWGMYLAEGSDWNHRTLRDIVGRLVKWGSISPKQMDFVRVLVRKIEDQPRIDAERAAERAAAEDCPEGRRVVEGTVVKAGWHENEYGGRNVMTVKSDDGWLVWGSVPSSIEVGRGDRVRFTGTLQQSDRDSKFGFFKRPSKAEVTERAQEEN